MIAANTFWYLENFRKRLISELAADHTLVLLGNRDSSWESIGPYRKIALNIETEGKNPFVELGVIWRLKRILDGERPDVVLTFTPKINLYFGLIADRSKCRLVLNISGFGNSRDLGGILQRFVNIGYRVAYSRAQAVFFQNQDDFEEAGSIFPSLSDRFIRIPGSGVDLSRFFPVNRESGIFRFLFVGRLLVKKGIREFIEAGKRIKSQYPRAEFWVAGPRDESPSYISESELDDAISSKAITYLGQVKQMETVYSQVNCVVLPTYYREGIPRSLI